MEPRWLDDMSEVTPRFNRAVRIIALILVIALILLLVVPAVIRMSRPSPPTTRPGIVANTSVLAGPVWVSNQVQLPVRPAWPGEPGEVAERSKALAC
ncbi:MAG: hypothetical protein GWP04_11955 [Gammaproteobacteria bacterium]|nr:hypothetical protein [Gammaproteobacteria bacterium]